MESEHNEKMTLKEIATELRETMGCNCDLDNWQPDERTGHSWVCRIHKTAINKYRRINNLSCGNVPY